MKPFLLLLMVVLSGCAQNQKQIINPCYDNSRGELEMANKYLDVAGVPRFDDHGSSVFTLAGRIKSMFTQYYVEQHVFYKERERIAKDLEAIK